MLKTRIILIISASVLVLAISFLPKVVVDNNSNSVSSAPKEATADQQTPASNPTHNQELTQEALRNIQKLKENLAANESIEKNVIFADSLAQLYLHYNQYDSAAKFIEIIAKNVPSTENWRRAGETFYEAFTFAMDADKRHDMAARSRGYFKKVLEKSPGDLEIKNKLAMTYLSTSNPMQGIKMLKDILVEDPENEKALFNLGALSMQSNQYDKAIERFGKLVELYPENTQARFFLAVSYLETGKKIEAKEHFEVVKELDKDPQVQANVDSYLEEIK